MMPYSPTSLQDALDKRFLKPPETPLQRVAMRLTRAACFLGWHIDGREPLSSARAFYSSLHCYWPIRIVTVWFLPRTPPAHALARTWCCGSSTLQTAITWLKIMVSPVRVEVPALVFLRVHLTR